MLASYLRMAVRHLRKGGGYAVLTISGLAIGLAVCLLIGLFVLDEFSYDRYNTKADRIYRIVSDIHLNGNGLNAVATPAPMGPALVRDYPLIEKAVRIRSQNGGVLRVRKGADMVMESNAVYADSTLFDIFSLSMIAGDAHTALVKPYSIVISESMARKYFSGTAAVGKTLITDDTTNYTVTGVIRDMPGTSHFHFDFIKSMAEKKLNFGLEWINFFSATYVLVKPGVTASAIDRMLAATVTKYIAPQLQTEMHSRLSEMERKGDYFRFYSMPLTEIHLHSHLVGELETNGSIQTVYIFGLIALFLLLIACSNFMNMSTARSAERFREIGVRKVLGSSRRALVVQFLAESVVTSFGALLLALLLVALLLPYFNQLSGKQIGFSVLGGLRNLSLLLLCPLVVGLLAGSYPALYLSALRPVRVLKGTFPTGVGGSRLRNGLIVFQFSAAIALIVGTLVVYDQLRFIRNRDIGFNRDQVLIVQNMDQLGSGATAFQQEVEKLPGVTGGTMTGDLPNKTYYATRGYFINAAAKASETVLLESWKIDDQYIPVLGMQVILGRNFSPAMPTDSSGVLINETAARLLGVVELADRFIYTGPDPVEQFRILGIVKDFNATTLRSKIEPIVFHLRADNHALSLRITGRNIPGLLAGIRERYRSMGGQAFEYSFMDDDFNKLYRADERTGRIFFSFAFLAIFTACLGLLGLATHAAEQRIREISIRKVLGATVRDIAVLLSGNFLKPLSMAILIGCPMAWWAMHRWLENFAYRTTIGAWEFALAGGMVLVVTVVVVGWRVVRAGRVNPVEGIRE